MMVNTTIASPKLPSKYPDIRTRKFSIGLCRIVFQMAVMETTRAMRREISTTMKMEMATLRTFTAVAALASPIAFSI
jgi:hypothetical protein